MASIAAVPSALGVRCLSAPSEGMSLKGICPEAPEWISKEDLAKLSHYIRSGWKGEFPYSRCTWDSHKLGLALALLWHGRLDDKGIYVRIGDKWGILSFVDYTFPQHHYLVLTFKGKEWVIDATWKQFVDRWQWPIDMNSPYNKSLWHDCPDILIIPREDMEGFMEKLEKCAASFPEWIRNKEPPSFYAKKWKSGVECNELFHVLFKTLAFPDPESFIKDIILNIDIGWEEFRKSIGLPDKPLCSLVRSILSPDTDDKKVS